MRPKKQRPIYFKNECSCKVDVVDLEKAILWYQKFPTKSKKKIYMHGKYPAVSIGDKKIHVHRLLLMYWEQRIIDRFEYAHHIDEDKLNSLRDNIELIWASKHQSLHNKGKVISDEHKMKLSEAGRKRKGMIIKKTVIIPLDELSKMLKGGSSINACAKHFNCSWTTIRLRICQNPEILKDV